MYPKLALHVLADSGAWTCGIGFSGSACDDAGSDPGLLTTAAVGDTVSVLLLALDVGLDEGLHAAIVRLHTDPGVTVLGWERCSDLEDPDATWPASGSTNRIVFSQCRGTEPDPADPEGDASVVLGRFRVTASERGSLWVHPGSPASFLLCDWSEVAQERGGGVTFTELAWYRGGWEPCSMIVDGCPVFEHTLTWRCCNDSKSCPEDPLAQRSFRACLYRGGVPVLRPCIALWWACSTFCDRTPVDRVSWGSIKARHR